MCWTDGFCQKWHSRVHPLPAVGRHAREIDFPPPSPPTLLRTPRIMVTSIYIHRYLYASVCDIKRVLDFLTFEFLVNIFLWPGWSGNRSPKTKKIFITIRLCTYFYNSRLTFTCSTMHALVFEV